MATRSIPRRPRAASTLLAVLLVAVLAACSSSSTTSTSPDTTARTGTSGSTPGTVAGKVIKIGVIAPLDAGLTDFGHGIKNSVQLAVDRANASGAIPGYTLQVEAVDDSSDPAIGEAAAKKLAADPSVIGVVGPYNSGVAAKAAPVFASSGITIISPSNTSPTLTLGEDPAKPVRPNATYFRMVGNDLSQASFLALEAKDKVGASTTDVVSETKAVSKGLADNFTAAYTKKGGTVATQMVVPDDASTFTDFLAAAKTNNPALLFFGGEYPVAAKLRAQATAAGITVPIMGGDGMKDDAYLREAGATAKGDLASSVGAPAADVESAKEYLAAYKSANFSQPPTDYGPYAFDAANLLIEAAGKAVAGGTPVDAAARAAVLATVQAADTKGASGAISFDAYGDAKRPTFTLYRVEDVGGTLAWKPLVTAVVG